MTTTPLESARGRVGLGPARSPAVVRVRARAVGQRHLDVRDLVPTGALRPHRDAESILPVGRVDLRPIDHHARSVLLRLGALLVCEQLRVSVRVQVLNNISS